MRAAPILAAALALCACGVKAPPRPPVREPAAATPPAATTPAQTPPAPPAPAGPAAP